MTTSNFNLNEEKNNNYNSSCSSNNIKSDTNDNNNNRSKNNNSIQNTTSSFPKPIRILLQGPSHVGKTTLLYSFSNDTKPSHFSRAFDFKMRYVEVEKDKLLKVQLWDFDDDIKVSPWLFSKFHGIILIYSVTDMNSFLGVQKVFNEIKTLNNQFSLILVGNKSETSFERVVDYNIVKEFSEREKIPFLEISAENHVNVEQILTILVLRLVKIDPTLNELLYHPQK